MNIKPILKTSSFGVAILCMSSSVDAALIGRLAATPGGADYQAYYDDILNVTWLADANLALTNQFGLDLSGSEFDDSANTVGSTGRMTIANANVWIDGMNSSNYLGFGDWRLPSADVNNDANVVSCFGGFDPAACADNELGHLYWQEGINFTNPSPFSNLQGTNYWSETEVGSLQYVLEFSGGFHGAVFKDSNVFALVVRSGDVSAVPIPAAIWLFGSGLIGLIGVARRKKF